MAPYQALVLVSFGGPERTEDVMPFLERVTDGRGIPRERLEAVAQHYYANGGASPINDQCRQLMGNLTEALAGMGLPLYWGNRNWHPLLEDTVAQMRDNGVESALAFVTSAYGGYSSCRQYQEDIAAAQAKVGAGAPRIDKLRLYYNHPGWVGPWVSSLRRALEVCGVVSSVAPTGPLDPPAGPVGPEDEQEEHGTATHTGPLVLFSAHSIPDAMARTSPYVEHVHDTARLVAQGARVTNWSLTWQSRSGSPSQPWLGPDITELIERSRARAIVVAPIGFVCDNMEITHDLDVEAAEVARKKGAHFVRAATVGTTAAFASMVRQLVQERLGLDGPARPALGLHGAWPDQCPQDHCPSPAQLRQAAPR